MVNEIDSKCHSFLAAIVDDPREAGNAKSYKKALEPQLKRSNNAESNKKAGNDILALRPAAIKGGRKEPEPGFLDGSVAAATPTELPDAPSPSVAPTRSRSALAPTRQGAPGPRHKPLSSAVTPLAPVERAQGGCGIEA